MRKHHHGDSIPSVNPTRDNKHRAIQGDTIARLCYVTEISATVELKRAACFLPRRAYENQSAHGTCTKTHRSSNSEQLLSLQVNHSVVFPAMGKLGVTRRRQLFGKKQILGVSIRKSCVMPRDARTEMAGSGGHVTPNKLILILPMKICMISSWIH